MKGCKVDDSHIVKQDLNPNFERFVARLQRAVQHREVLESYCKEESAVTVNTTAKDCLVTVAIKQSTSIPPLASTILSDWLHQIRSALDGAFYTLAALETNSYPPSQARTRTFPIRTTRADFDQMLASDSNPTRGMTKSTIESIERSQPYHGKYGADGDSLLWIHNMARIDRHRHSFSLALRVIPNENNGLDFAARCPRPVAVTPGPENTVLKSEEETVFAVIEYDSAETARHSVSESWISPRFTFGLEASEWYRDAVANSLSQNIRNDSLTTRMRFCEWVVSALVKMLSDQISIEQLHVPDWVNVGN